MESRVALAQVCANMGCRAAAARHLREAARSASADPEDYWHIGSVLLDLAHPRAAIRVYRKALAGFPDCPELLHNIALAYMDCRSWARALQYADAAVAAQPTFEPAHYTRGWVLDEMGRYEDAVLAYRIALELNAADVQTYVSLGSALHRLGRYREAVQTCRRALALAPPSARVCTNLGLALLAAGEPSEAEVHLRAALRLDPARVSAAVSLAALLYDTGRPAEAMGYWLRARDLDPLNPEPLFWFGRALMELRQWGEAEGVFAALVENDPDGDYAGSSREQLAAIAGERLSAAANVDA